MALFHFTVTQTKRSKGQSAIASAAYRSGEKLYSEYYGEYSDYTRKRGLDVRIDHRSYERQGVDLLPTIHEGATVRAMEKKGIRTEKGEFNRWIKATNAVIKDIRKKISLLFDWIMEIKAELAKPQTPDLVSLLNDYYTQRKAGAYSQKGKISNLKEMNETYNYLRANGIYTLEDLESRLQSHRTTVDGLKTTMDSQNARMKAIRSLNDYSATYKS